MKKFILVFSLLMVGVTGLVGSQTAEAKHHKNYQRVYLAPRDVVYVRGAPYCRYNRAPVYVVQDRFGYPSSYYVVNPNYGVQYGYGYQAPPRYREVNYAYRPRPYYRNGLTIIYRP